MNRLIIVLSLLIAATAATAGNYFTMGEEDTVRVAAGTDTVTVPVRAIFDNRVGQWNLDVAWPEGLTPVSFAEGPGMTVAYLNGNGEECLFNAVITTTADMCVFSSFITVTGYVLYGGSYYPYGTAKWEPGVYDEMFYLTMAIAEGFTGGTVSIDGQLSGSDVLGNCVGNVSFYRQVVFTVTQVPGDVNGDGKVNISDVTELINILLTGAEAPAAADVDGDGKVSISDVTALIDRLLSASALVFRNN